MYLHIFYLQNDPWILPQTDPENGQELIKSSLMIAGYDSLNLYMSLYMSISKTTTMTSG